MSGYHGTRKNGVNVSQYIANLNKEPSAFEMARAEEQSYAVDDESLTQFTNADFLEFDNDNFLSDGGAVGGALDFDDGAKSDKQKADMATSSDGMDFVNGTFPLQAVNPFNINPSLYTATTTGPANNTTNPPSTTTPTNPTYHPLPYPPHPHPYHTTAPPYHAGKPPGPPSISSPTSDPTSPTAGDPARALAEEDKRRRNTAASARFRVKKKQREQALEQKTQELEKAKQTLEQRVGQLETENEWLRGLVVEKNGAVKGGKGEGEEVEGEERKGGGKKKGVGTEV